MPSPWSSFNSTNRSERVWWAICFTENTAFAFTSTVLLDVELTSCLHESFGPIGEAALRLQREAAAGVLSGSLQVNNSLHTTPEDNITHVNRVKEWKHNQS